ncbi:Peroxisomal biogenesis factor 11 (PEX11) [Plasmodiophora brassicae]
MSSSLDRVVAFLNTTTGRDAATRMLQYAVKALIWTDTAAAASTPLGKLYAAVSMSRKVLRLSRSLALLNEVDSRVPSTDANGRLLERARWFLHVFYIADHVIWLERLGALAIPPRAHDFVLTVKMLTWLARTACIGMYNAQRLARHPHLKERLPDDDPLEEAGAVAARDFGVCSRAVVCACLDALVIIHLLGWPGALHRIPSGLFGLLGAVSSALSLYDSAAIQEPII